MASEAVEHYKKKLQRHIDDPEVVLHCIRKLDAADMTIQILQDSKVGKVVNKLKKRPDTSSEVIEAARKLVEKWKELVMNEEENDEEAEEIEAVKPHKSRHNPSTSVDDEKSKRSSSNGSSSKHHHPKKEKKEKSKSKDHHHKHHKSSSKDKSTDKKVKNTSSLVEIPLDLNPNYKPQPRIPLPPDPTERSNGHHQRNNSLFSREEVEDDWTTMMMKAKSSRGRTAVYSGKKTSAFSRDEEFPTLRQLCIHVLQDNVTRIDECGGLDFFTLEPVLERAKPGDLIRIEDLNPYLMEHTGNLWKKIVHKHFPKGDREEFESYREMYERLIQERETKLDKLMGKVQRSYASLKTTNKQTKLAYVDTVAKPPRGVKRAQEKNGTAFSFGMDKVKKARMSSIGASTAGGSGPSATGSGPKKPKVAPIMAKTLKMARGLKTGFRR